MELFQGDAGLLAMLMTGLVATGVAIVADFTPERRRQRAGAKTQRLTLPPR